MAATFQQRLVASDFAASEFFGTSVAMRGNWLAVATMPHWANPVATCSVYLFEYSGGTWTERQKFGLGLRYEFFTVKWTVALAFSPNGQYLAVGEGGNKIVRLYVNTGGTWAPATGTATLASPEPNPLLVGLYGFSVAMTDDLLIVGEPNHPGGLGRAWAYLRSGETWAQEAEITSAGVQPGYGISCAIDESTIGGAKLRLAIGATSTWEQYGGAAGTDGVHLWTREDDGLGTITWTPTDLLYYSAHAVPLDWRGFGYKIAMANDKLIALDRMHPISQPIPRTQRVYGFVRDPGLETYGTDGASVQYTEIVYGYNNMSPISGMAYLFGAPNQGGPADAGRCYITQYSAGAWGITEFFDCATLPLAGDTYFGAALAILGNVGIVSASHEDEGVTADAGSVYVYDLGIIPAPVADFSGTPLSGSAPLTVAFTDLSTNTPTSWAWTFGDGGTSTDQNPTHVYGYPGTYAVALTATNLGGANTMSKAAYVTVGALAPKPSSFGSNLFTVTIMALGEVLGELIGNRLTRLTAPAAAGDATLSVESVRDLPTSGKIYLPGERSAITYSGVTEAIGANRLTGVSGLTIAHALGEIVTDGSGNCSTYDELTRALHVDYAVGDDLRRIGRNNGVEVFAAMPDATLRALIKVLAYLPRTTYYALEQVLTALYPGGGYALYESLTEQPGAVFITLPGEVGSDPTGRSYAMVREAAVSSSTTDVAVADAPLIIEAVKLANILSDYTMAVLPSVATDPFAFATGGGGVENTFFVVTAGELEHTQPAGTPGGRYERTILELAEEYNTVEANWNWAVDTTVAGYPWKMAIADGARRYCLAWNKTAAVLCDIDETVIAGPVTIATAVGVYRKFRLERNGDNVRGYLDNQEIISALAADFPTTTDQYAAFGYWDCGAANEWTAKWDDLRVVVRNNKNYWNRHGSDGSLAVGSTTLTSAAGPFVVEYVNRLVFLDAVSDLNFGTWLISAFSDAQNVTLDGVAYADAYMDVLQPDRLFLAENTFDERCVGRSVTISGSVGGANDGTFVIASRIGPREVQLTGATFVTDTDCTWKYEPIFANEATIPFQVIDAGDIVAGALVLREPLPSATQSVEVDYATIVSGQVLADETIANLGGTAYYPLYVYGPDQDILDILEDVLAAGVRLIAPRP